MELEMGIAVTLALGAAALSLMYLFVEACDRV